MPLFGKPDEAKKRFREAKNCSDPRNKEFDLDRAINLLEEATMLKPDKKQYREKLDELRKVELRRAKSSTSRYPTPKDVYLYLLSKYEAEGGEFVTFQQQDEKIWVQALFSDEGTTINFSYPSDEDPNQLISKLGITFPSGYVLSGWEGQLYATFAGAKCSHSELAQTVDELFTKLLGASPNYVVDGWIEE